MNANVRANRAAPLIVLVGAPGAGKTTIGMLVAELLGVDFRDTDADVEQRTGQTVADVFVEHGEAAFRALERAAVADALATHRGVLALGGGAVLDADTRTALKDHRVVWLRVSMPEAVRRVGLARDRPVIALNPRAQLARLLAERTPFYEAVATAAVDTDGREPAEVARQLSALAAAAERPSEVRAEMPVDRP